MRTTFVLFFLFIISVLNSLTAQVTFNPKSLISGISGNPLKILTADLNGDGHLDIISGESWWENDGNSNFTINTIYSGALLNYADMDGDGDVDLLGIGANFPGPNVSGEIVWYENDDSGPFDQHPIGFLSGTLGAFIDDIYPVDMDGDGDLDVVTSGATQELTGPSGAQLLGQTIWWENIGLGNPFVRHQINSGLNSFPVDIDGDGDIDVVTRGSVNIFPTNNTSVRLDVFLNDGNGNLTENNIYNELNGNVGSILHVADVDNDDLPDILTNRFSWWKNMGNNVFVENIIQEGNVSDVNSADVDGDGDVDIITVGEFKSWWEYDGNGGFIEHQISDAPAFHVLGSDLDQDGDMDILSEFLGEIVFWEQADPVVGNCPDNIAGFTSLGEFNDHKYFLSDDIHAWEEASTLAAANGGYLASINSSEENTFLYEKLGTQIVHIGFNDAATEGNFAWDSGDAIGFNKHDGANSEDNDYGVLNFWDGSWTLVNQWVHKKILIEVPCGMSSPALTLTCPDPISTSIANGQTEVVVDFPEVGISHNCGTVEINQISGLPSGSSFPLGTTVNEYEVVLTCGTEVLTASCSFTVSVEEIDINCTENIPGFIYWGEYNDHKYFLSEGIHTWSVAQSMAIANGAYLASIEDQDENDFLQNQLNFNIVHIGFNDESTEGNFAWDNGDAVGFNKHDGANSEDDDYGVLNFWDGSWTLVNKWVQKQFIMEVPCEVTTNPVATSLEITCSAPIFIMVDFPATGAVISYPEPGVTFSCATGGTISHQVISGPESGTFQPIGIHTIEYETTLFCGTDIIKDTCFIWVEVTDVGTVIGTGPGSNQSNEHPRPGDKFHNLSFGIRNIFPNPADKRLTLSILSEEDRGTSLEIFDAFGKRVFAESVNLYKGETQIPVDISEFMAGTFTVKIAAKGQRTKTMRFVKILD